MEAIVDSESTQLVTPISYLYRVPEKPLSEFASYFWYWQGQNVSYSKGERILPMGTVELVIDLRSGRTSDSGISGPHSQSILVERTVHDELLGIHFNPGGAFPFLGFTLGDLHNRGITLADLWGEGNAGELLQLLQDAKTVEMKFQVLERWLTLTALRPLTHHPAVAFALSVFQSDPTLLTSAQMAERIGLSQRHFIQLFRNEVGLTPKLFCRVQRFQDIIHTIHEQSDVDWVDIALSFGYFDQAHFIHDFREFSGLSPTEYLGLRTAYPQHLQVPD